MPKFLDEVAAGGLASFEPSSKTSASAGWSVMYDWGTAHAMGGSSSSGAAAQT